MDALGARARLAAAPAEQQADEGAGTTQHTGSGKSQEGREAGGEGARSQRAWMEKGVKNARRKQPDRDKVGRGFRIEATEKQAAKARGLAEKRARGDAERASRQHAG